jgi:hypothetical protein
MSASMNGSQPPPQNVEAEESVLGALMLAHTDSNVVEKVLATGITEGAFHRESHGRIFQAITALHSRGVSVDPLMVADELEKRGELESAGGRVRLHELACLVPATRNAPHHAKLVIEADQLRALIRAGGELAQLGWERPGAIAELHARAHDVVEHAIADRRGVDAEKATGGWRVHDLVSAQATPTAPPDLLGLFYAGKNHLVSGETESAKTWLALVAVVEELAADRGVVWVDGDDVGEGDLLERLRSLGATDEAISKLFAYVQPDEPLGEEQRTELLEHMKTIDCRLVVLDGFNPLLVLHGLDPDSGKDVERFYRLIAPFKRSGAAVLLTDNVVKSKEARGTWAIGSERKKSKAEVHLGLRAVEKFSRGHDGKSKIDVHKDRPGHLERPSPGMLGLESGDGGRVLWRVDSDHSVSEEGGFRPTGLMEKVSRYLEPRDEPVSRNQVVTDVTGKAEFVRIAIDRLVSEGYAEEHPGANRARLVQIVQAYREDDEEGIE